MTESKLKVRELMPQERAEALRIIWEVFLADVAPSYTEEGIEAFRQYLAYEHIELLCNREELTMFGVFDGEKLEGTISLQSRGHICNFYVKKSCQGKGAGRQLFQAACDYCVKNLGKRNLTVDAAPGAVAKYTHMGMEAIGKEQMINGKCYVPMMKQL